MALNISNLVQKPAWQSKVQGVIQSPYAKKPPTPVVSQPSAPSAPVKSLAPSVPPKQPTTPSGIPVSGDLSTWAGVPKPERPVRGLFPNVVDSLRIKSTEPNKITTESVERARRIAEDLTRSRKLQAGAEASQRLAPIPIGDATGRQAVTRQQYETQQAALASQLEAETALAGIGQTQQNIEIGGLGTAAGLVAPSVAQYGQTVFDPATGTYKNADGGNATGLSLDPVGNLPSIVRGVLGGQISPSQALSMGGSVSNWQNILTNELLKQNPGTNLADLQARFDARLQSGTLAGFTPTSAAATAYSDAYQTYNVMRGQVINVDNLGNLLLDVARTGAINPTDLTIGNRTIADLKRGLSTADQVKFDSALSAFSGAASQLLASGSGQIPTAVSENIAKIANGTLSLPALSAMVEQAKREGNVKLQTAASLVNVPGTSIGAPQVSAPTTATPQQGVTPSGIRYTVSP